MDRIEFYNLKIDTYVQNRLNKGYTFFDLDLEGVDPALRQEWIGKYDGQTRNGEKFTLQYTKNSWTTGPNAAPWVFYNIVNKGEIKNYMKNDEKHRIQNFMMRSVGTSNKCKIRADFTFKNGNDDWVPLAG